VTVPAQSSQKYWDTPLPEVFPEPCQHERFITLQFAGPGVDARNAYYPEPFKAARLESASFQISDWQAWELGWEFTVTSDRPAPYVYLSAGNLRGRFSDNGFLLLPGLPCRVRFQATGLSRETLQSQLSVRGPV
jgi:hypothetical protein